MATNAQTQHVSTFIKGMDTDTSDMVLAADKYRYAENIRIITNQDSNTGEVRLIEGAQLQFDINHIISVLGISGDDWTIRESTQIRQYGILICENSEGKWFVAKYNKTRIVNSNPWGITKVFGVCDEMLGEYKLSLVTNYEDDDNVKLYIADGEHKLMSINIKDSVVYNTISDITDETDSEDLEPITSIKIIDGNLIAGRIMYCYQFYNINGVQTRVSPISKPLSTNNYSGTTNWYGLEQGTYSTLGFEISFGTEQNYNHVKVYRITFIDSTSQPLCELIIDRYYDYSTEPNIVIADRGLAAISIMDVSEIANILYYQLIPKIIESKNNRLFVSNVKYPTDRGFIEWDARAYAKKDKYNLTSYALNQDNEVVDDIPISADIINDNSNLSDPYDASCWQPMGGWNGIGKNIKWRYFEQSNGDWQPVADTDLNKRYISKQSYSNPSNENYEGTAESFRRNEMYRFGIILYDSSGFQYPVKWIADIRTKDIKNSLPFVQDGTQLKSIPLYIEFQVSNLPQNCVKFEIVRCKLTIKDRATVTQGVISNTVGYLNGSQTAENRCPSGLISLQHLVYPWRILEFGYTGGDPKANMQAPRQSYITGTRNELTGTNTYGNNYTDEINNPGLTLWEILGHSKNDLFQFISPEITYSNTDVKNVIENNKSNLKLNLEYIYSPHGFTTIDIQSENEYGLSDFLRRKNSLSQTPTYANVDFSDTYKPYGYSSIGFCRIHLGGGSNDDGLFFYDGSEITSIAGSYGASLDQNDLIASNDQVIYLFPIGYSQEILNRYVNDISTDRTNLPYLEKSTFGHTDGADRDHSTASDLYVKLVPNDLLSFNTSSLQIKNDFKFVNQVLNTQQIDFENVSSLYNTQYLVDTYKFIPYVFFQGWLRRNTRMADLFSAAEYYTDEKFIEEIQLRNNWSDGRWSFTNLCPVAIAGPSMLFSFQNNNPSQLTLDDITDNFGNTYLCNLRKPVTPYGGMTYQSRTNSIYYSYGIVKRTEDQQNQYDVLFDRGDCFLECFEYKSAYKVSKHPAYWLRTFGATYSIPLEMDIDVYNDYGTTWSKHINNPNQYVNGSNGPMSIDYWPFMQYSPCVVRDSWYVQNDYQYLYNPAYNADTTIQSFAGISQEDILSLDKADCRTFYSELKTQNEVQDSWLKFKAANFLDVDQKYGPITALKNFNNQLIYWQEQAVGGFSVNEKQMLENADGNNLILGTGDVLSRYDYISTTYGMKPDQYAYVASDKDLYWWDENKKELLSYRYSKSLVPSKGIVELGLQKSVKNYLNELEVNDQPLLTWDVDNQEVMFTVGNNQTLTYSELLDVFTSVYKIVPKNKVVFADKLQLLTDTEVYQWNTLETTNSTGASGFGLDSDTVRTRLFPLIQATVNTASTQPKVFDTIEFGGRFYGGGEAQNRTTPIYLQIQKDRDLGGLNNLRFEFSTPTKQRGYINDKNIGKHLTNIEYDFKMSLPRNGEGDVNPIGHNDKALHYGDRFKGKFMNYTLSSVSNDLDFSLQYIITKFRASWN